MKELLALINSGHPDSDITLCKESARYDVCQFKFTNTGRTFFVSYIGLDNVFTITVLNNSTSNLYYFKGNYDLALAWIKNLAV